MAIAATNVQAPGAPSEHPRPKRDPFSMVPDWLIGQVSFAALGLFAGLAKFADGKGDRCFPSRKTLAELGACSTKNIDRLMADLVAAGAVEKKNRPGPGRHNTYRLHFEPPPRLRVVREPDEGEVERDAGGPFEAPSSGTSGDLLGVERDTGGPLKGTPVACSKRTPVARSIEQDPVQLDPREPDPLTPPPTPPLAAFCGSGGEEGNGGGDLFLTAFGSLLSGQGVIEARVVDQALATKESPANEAQRQRPPSKWLTAPERPEDFDWCGECGAAGLVEDDGGVARACPCPRAQALARRRQANAIRWGHLLPDPDREPAPAVLSGVSGVPQKGADT